jgi:small subunit ribosomal protein S6
MTRLYETIYILKTDLPEHGLDEALSKYQTLLQEQNAESITVQHRGKRRLAYEINKNREGIYIQMNYIAKPGTVEILEKFLRLDEAVIRFLTTKTTQETMTAVEIPLPPEPPAPPTIVDRSDRPKPEVLVNKPVVEAVTEVAAEEQAEEQTDEVVVSATEE